MTITQYLGTGTTSRGRMTITKQLNTVVSTPPYLRDAHDREAVIMGLNSLRASLNGVSNLGWISPSSGAATEQFVDSVSESPHAQDMYRWTWANTGDRSRLSLGVAAPTTGLVRSPRSSTATSDANM